MCTAGHLRPAAYNHSSDPMAHRFASNAVLKEHDVGNPVCSAGKPFSSTCAGVAPRLSSLLWRLDDVCCTAKGVATAACLALLTVTGATPLPELCDTQDRACTGRSTMPPIGRTNARFRSGRSTRNVRQCTNAADSLDRPHHPRAAVSRRGCLS